MDYAPIANRYLEPKTSMVEVRSFSGDSEAYLPGHDNTADDSQYGTPVVVKTKNELEAYELVPFRQAMKAGQDAVMAADISLTRLDNTFYIVVDDLPANLSPNLIRNSREEMKYGIDKKEAVMALKVIATDMITNINTQSPYI
ncbi:putative beta-n- protein [Botrytis fragariae]|uniref:Putative beta-n- protein n=1 Tax=Botrytis fragariae TaxID=1964551 RepID=A0A8H6EGA3_9HELO|nr:putative beta-n- protein [Botrytis fragariae]KAF5871202.1 putative beta-n- protein [Botrytis fragariae]